MWIVGGGQWWLPRDSIYNISGKEKSSTWIHLLYYNNSGEKVGTMSLFIVTSLSAYYSCDDIIDEVIEVLTLGNERVLEVR